MLQVSALVKSQVLNFHHLVGIQNSATTSEHPIPALKMTTSTTLHNFITRAERVSRKLKSLIYSLMRQRRRWKAGDEVLRRLYTALQAFTNCWRRRRSSPRFNIEWVITPSRLIAFLLRLRDDENRWAIKQSFLQYETWKIYAASNLHNSRENEIKTKYLNAIPSRAKWGSRMRCFKNIYSISMEKGAWCEGQ